MSFKPVPGFEGLYNIDENGIVFSQQRKRTINPYKGSDGYYYIRLHKEAKMTRKAVHYFVAITFIGYTDKENPEINHKDGDKLNNHFSNLEWVTKQENCRHASENKLYPSGERHYNYKKGGVNGKG